jgi:hypothetical protein
MYQLDLVSKSNTLNAPNKLIFYASTIKPTEYSSKTHTVLFLPAFLFILNYTARSLLLLLLFLFYVQSKQKNLVTDANNTGCL